MFDSRHCHPSASDKRFNMKHTRASTTTTTFTVDDVDERTLNVNGTSTSARVLSIELPFILGWCTSDPLTLTHTNAPIVENIITIMAIKLSRRRWSGKWKGKATRKSVADRCKPHSDRADSGQQLLTQIHNVNSLGTHPNCALTNYLWYFMATAGHNKRFHFRFRFRSSNNSIMQFTD